MSLCAYAEENIDTSTEEWTKYYVSALCSYSKNGEYNIRGYYYDCAFSIDKKLAAYLKNGDFEMYLYDDTGIVCDMSTDLGRLKNYCNWNVDAGGVIQFGDYIYQYDGHTFDFFDLSWETSNNLQANLNWDTDNIEDSGFINTNIPYFATQEECLSYINGDIGAETALNFSSDLLTTVTDSDEVPLPKNLRIEYDSTNYNYYLMWEYEPKDLEKLTVIAVTGMDKDLFISPKNLDNYMRYPADIEYDVSLDEYLEPRLSYKLDITDDVVRLRRTIDEENDFSLADYRVTLDYWVIGSWQKNSTEFHTSKISHVELILDSSDKGFKIDTDNYITDKDMNVLDDVEFDTSIDFDTNNSSSGFIGNLVGAFGLLGNNGFLACCKAVFGCFPAFIWDLLGAGLSVAIVIVLIKILFS